MKRILGLVSLLLLSPCLLWAGEKEVTLSFSNTPLAVVLDQYALLTGKTVLCQPGLGATVNLTSKPMPKQKAIELIELTLTMFNNFFVALDDDTMVLVSGGGYPTFPIPLITDPKKIPPGHQLIIYQMNVRHLSRAQLSSSLQAFICGSARLITPPDEKILLVQAPASLVRGLLAVQDLVDVPLEQPAPNTPLPKAEKAR
mgnify:CR=1 FL=1